MHLRESSSERTRAELSNFVAAQLATTCCSRRRQAPNIYGLWRLRKRVLGVLSTRKEPRPESGRIGKQAIAGRSLSPLNRHAASSNLTTIRLPSAASAA